MHDYQLIRNNTLFNDLSDNELARLLKIAHRLKIKKDEYFIHEGDRAEHFYIILSGKVAITKLDKDNIHDHIIASLDAGHSIGEMALLDHKPRSASAKAVENVQLLTIAFDDLKKLSKENPKYQKVASRIAESISGRIRVTNITVVEALENQVKEYKMRTALGLFMVEVIVAICAFTFFLSWLIHQSRGVIASTVISVPLTFAFLFLFFMIIKSSHFPLRTFGLTTKNWRIAVIESLGFTAILCFILFLVKWMLIHFGIAYHGHAVFEPYLSLQLERQAIFVSKEQAWWIILAVYWLIVAPMQELIARGALQSPMEIFLTGKYAALKANLVANTMFATGHLFMGTEMAFWVFAGGIYLGWLYSRHHTLIGVILAHALLGTWATMFIGI